MRLTGVKERERRSFLGGFGSCSSFPNNFCTATAPSTFESKHTMCIDGARRGREDSSACWYCKIVLFFWVMVGLLAAWACFQVLPLFQPRQSVRQPYDDSTYSVAPGFPVIINGSASQNSSFLATIDLEWNGNVDSLIERLCFINGSRSTILGDAQAFVPYPIHPSNKNYIIPECNASDPIPSRSDMRSSSRLH